MLAYQPPLPTNVRGYDGNPVQTFARERRVELAYDEYPQLVVDAFISAEDKTFFSHGGIDYPGLVGAVFDYTRKSVSGGRAKGGSTITQQVAKALLQDSSYSIGRKIREAILAFRLESTLSKEQILELYLNQIFLGRNAYGVQAASRAYFDKDVGELTLPEAAYLAVLPKAPSNYDPVRATERALDRRNYVLQEMEANGFITADQRLAAAAAAARHDPLRQQRQVPRNGRLFHGGGPPRPDEEVRRERRRRARTASMPAACGCGPRWSRTCRTPPRKRCARASPSSTAAAAGATSGSASTSPATGAAQLDRGAGRHRLSRLAQGGRPVEERRPGAASASATGRPGCLPASAASQPKRGVGGSAFGYLARA